MADMPPILVFLIIFLLLGGGGWITSQITAALSHRRALATQKEQAKLPPKPVCTGCDHGLSFHDPRTGACVHDVDKVIKWETRKVRPDDADSFKFSIRIGTYEDTDDYEDYALIKVPVEWEAATCACLRYVGPEPMITLTAPDLSDTALETGHQAAPDHPGRQADAERRPAPLQNPPATA